MVGQWSTASVNWTSWSWRTPLRFKSQGSEYPAVVIPLTTQHYTMLARSGVGPRVVADGGEELRHDPVVDVQGGRRHPIAHLGGHGHRPGQGGSSAVSRPSSPNGDKRNSAACATAASTRSAIWPSC